MLAKGPAWGEFTLGRAESICTLSAAEKVGLPWACYTVLYDPEEENTPP